LSRRRGGSRGRSPRGSCHRLAADHDKPGDEGDELDGLIARGDDRKALLLAPPVEHGEDHAFGLVVDLVEGESTTSSLGSSTRARAISALRWMPAAVPRAAAGDVPEAEDLDQSVDLQRDILLRWNEMVPHGKSYVIPQRLVVNQGGAWRHKTHLDPQPPHLPVTAGEPGLSSKTPDEISPQAISPASGRFRPASISRRGREPSSQRP